MKYLKKFGPGFGFLIFMIAATVSFIFTYEDRNMSDGVSLVLIVIFCLTCAVLTTFPNSRFAKVIIHSKRGRQFFAVILVIMILMSFILKFI